MPVNSFENYHLSWYPEREKLKTPYYKSLAGLLEADILSGKLTSGTKLPPQRELADYLDIHFTTVTRAYEECKKRNLIYGVGGSGTFVSPQAVNPITNSMDTMLRHSAALGYETAIELGFASSFDETNQLVVDCLPQMLQANALKTNLNYTNPTGSDRHKDLALKWMAQFGIRAPASQTAIVSGSMNALTLCFLSLFKPGDRVAVDQYIITNFIELAKLFHIHLIPVRMDREGMIPEMLDQACQQHSVSGIYLMPSCNNPTTICMPITRKIALTHVIKKHNLLVLEDDQHAFSTAGYISDYIVPFRELLPEQTIYICNTTTSICSGLRIAFMVCPYKVLDVIYNAICNVNVKSSAIDTELICQMIESGLANQIAKEKIALAKAANEIFDEIFPDNFTGHPYSYFRWLEIPKSHQDDPVGWELLSKGVHVYHSRRFLCGKNEDTNYLRIALSSAESQEQLRKGLLIIKDHFHM